MKGVNSNYRLQKVLPGQEWDALVRQSEHGTLFASSKYLECLGANSVHYFCYLADELRGAFFAIEDESGKNLILDDFVIYSGILMGPSTTGQNISQINSEKFRIAEFIAGELVARYRNIEFALAPEWSDIRPFLWINYHGGGNRFKADVRYTSMLDISRVDWKGDWQKSTLFQNLSKSRRQEIRYAIRDGIEVKNIPDSNLFLDLYSETFTRQGIQVEPEKLESLKNLLNNLLKNKNLYMYVAYTNDGDVASIACFSKFNSKAYYLFGANNPSLRNTHAGSMVLWESFCELSKLGVNMVDLEGVNSPERGWFKMSFGGQLHPYYEISLTR